MSARGGVGPLGAPRVVGLLAAGALLVALGAWVGWQRASAVPDLERWDGLIQAAALEQALDPDLLRALVAVESGGDPEARSRAGAVGLCQLMPATAREEAARLAVPDYDEDRRLEPALNLRLGAAYLARLLRRFEGEVAFAVAAYNAGPTRVTRWRERAPDVPPEQVIWREGYGETRRHLQRLLRFYAAYRARRAP